MSNQTSSNLNPSAHYSHVDLPRRVVGIQPAIHEQIRGEQVEEITPVYNVEKIFTDVIQKTQPLIDHQIMPVTIEERSLPTEILADEILPTTAIPRPHDFSTVNIQQAENRVIQKPQIVYETEKTQIIEEIQPVIYKETIVPTVLRSTRPLYQKVVESPIFTQETLPSRPLHGSGYDYPQPQQQPILTQPAPAMPAPVLQHEIPIQQTGASEQINPQIIRRQPHITKEEIKTTTTSTTNAPYQPIHTL